MKQICQKIDCAFQDLLKRATQRKLNIKNGNTLNKKLATELPTFRSLDTIMVIQKNNTSHLINRL